MISPSLTKFRVWMKKCGEKWPKMLYSTFLLLFLRHVSKWKETTDTWFEWYSKPLKVLRVLVIVVILVLNLHHCSMRIELLYLTVGGEIFFNPWSQTTSVWRTEKGRLREIQMENVNPSLWLTVVFHIPSNFGLGFYQNSINLRHIVIASWPF